MRAPAKVRMIGEPRELTREDMGTLFQGAYRPQISAEKLRNSHHRIARLSAAGLRQKEICDKTGYSSQRIYILLQSPAMQDLVARYKTVVDAAFERAQDPYMEAGVANMLLAEGMIADQLEEAEEAGEKLPLKDLLAISSDRADRFGYGKKSMVFNPGSDFAALLEKAVARSNNPAKLVDALEIEANA